MKQHQRKAQLCKLNHIRVARSIRITGKLKPGISHATAQKQDFNETTQTQSTTLETNSHKCRPRNYDNKKTEK